MINRDLIKGLALEHSDSPKGGKILKILFSSYCDNNCYYCIWRRDRNVKRFVYNPEKLSKFIIEYSKKRPISGIFLTSGVFKNPNRTMENLIKVVEILKFKFGYKNYIHLKVLPNVEYSLMERAKEIADRVSLNLEAPCENYLKKLSPDKKFKDGLFKQLLELAKIKGKAGLSTQFVVGAYEEKDIDYLKIADLLYKKYNFKRVYYSGFQPIPNTPMENLKSTSKLREYRLYQADTLLRIYKFSLKEIPFDKNGNLPLDKDPKLSWALKNIHLFPIEINKAEPEELIRIPGIGIKTAQKIIKMRVKQKIKDPEILKKLGVNLKKAEKFILIDGKTPIRKSFVYITLF